MKILVIGDLVGEGAVEYLLKELPKIKKEENINFVIVNAENAAGGFGLTTKLYNDISKMGVDVITMGNHTWAKRDIFTFIENKNIVRPANYSENLPGHGYTIIEKDNKKVCVINLIGRVEMPVLSDNAMLKVNKILEEVKGKADIIMVDFHAEATGEKLAMGYYLNGRATGVYGTHSHVQTSDECILDKGTGYITDIGMTGPIKSVLGMDINVSIRRSETTLPEKYKLATGPCKMEGCIFEINDENCRVINIRRIRRK